MFADDPTFIKCQQDSNPIIDSDICEMSKNFFDNNLTVKIPECKAMLFGSKQPHGVSLIDTAITY